MNRDEERRKNRERMPNLAAAIDEIREKFPDARLVWGKDLVTGHEVGTKDEPDPDKVFQIPKGYEPMKKYNVKTRKAK